MPCFELTALKFQSTNEIARWLITNDLLFWVPGEEKQRSTLFSDGCHLWRNKNKIIYNNIEDKNNGSNLKSMRLRPE